MKRVPRRWGSRFGSFVGEFTVERLTQELHGRGVPVTRSAIYKWIAGRALPRPDAANAIVSVSGGRVQLSDIYTKAPWGRSGQPGAPASPGKTIDR